MRIDIPFTLDGYDYRLIFDRYLVSFYLIPTKKVLSNINYKKNPELALFWDEPIYEDVDYKINGVKVFNKVRTILETIIFRHNIKYFEFSASTVKKVFVYEKMLERWVKSSKRKFTWTRDGIDFFVFVEQE